MASRNPGLTREVEEWRRIPQCEHWLEGLTLEDLPDIVQELLEMDELSDDDDFESDVPTSTEEPVLLRYPLRTTATPVEVEFEVATVGFLDDNVLEVMADASVLSETTECQPPEHSAYTVGETTYYTRLEVLDRLFRISEGLMKENLAAYPVEMMEIYMMDEEQYLRYSRYYRKTEAALNKATKISLANMPLTTYHKFQMIESLPVESRAVFYGFAHSQHHGYRAYRGKILGLYDTDSVNRGMFKTGNILDWEKHVRADQPDVIISDVAVGDSDDMGFKGSDVILDCYKAMYNMGLQVVYKSHIRQPPVGTVVRWSKQRSHNEEVIYWVDPRASEGVEVPDFDIEIANAERNDCIQAGDPGGFSPWPLPNWREVWKPGVSGWKGPEGLKNMNRFHELARSGYTKEWESWCKDPYVKFTPVEPGLVFVKTPFALQDVEPIGDPYEFISTVFCSFNMEYDEEVGWYATSPLQSGSVDPEQLIE